MGERRIQRETTLKDRVREFLGLERNVLTASSAVFLLGLGEELWQKFLPKYIEALGGGTAVVGLFGTAQDSFDALYQYPGGWLADRLGRRRGFLLFIALASAGYLTYLLAASWPLLFAGLAFVMAWRSMASPAIFAVIGDALARERRAMGFTLQSILRRVPMAVSPLLGAAMIAWLGIRSGMRAAFAVTLVMAALTALIVKTINLPPAGRDRANIRGVWDGFHAALRKLLLSDIIIRTCEGLAGVFVVLYVTNHAGLSMSQYGLLVAIQMTTSMVVYLPVARIADRIGRKPFVIATFVCFAFFPICVVLASNFWQMLAAFVIGGLREIGEPSRKAMIVDLAAPHLRARTVGLYYLIRSLSVTPAAAIGGLLWKLAPRTPFVIAAVIGILGTFVFAFTVEERYAS